MPVESNSHPSLKNGHHPPLRPIVEYTAQAYEEDDLDLKQILRIARRRMWIISGVAIAVTSAIWVWTLTRTPIYGGEFRLLVEATTANETSRQLLQGNQLQLASNFDYATQIEVLLSPALLTPIVERLQDTYPDITYSSLLKNLSIARLEETKVLSIGYRDPDPQKVQVVLEQLSEHYLRYSFQQRQASLQQGVQFVEEQLPELRERVNTLQIKLERFRQQYSILDPESRGGELSGMLSGIESQREETQTKLTEAQSFYTILQRQLGYSPQEAIAASALSESPRYQNILNQIQQVEAEIAVESARFQPDSPNVQALLDKRATLLPLIEQEAQRVLGRNASLSNNGNLTSVSLDLSRQLINTANQVQVLQARSQALARVEGRLKQEFSLVPALARQYTDLQRELNVATESLNRFLATRETLQIEAAQNSVPWQQISSPSKPQFPLYPNIPRNLTLGAIVGLLLGGAAALLTEKLDNVFHSTDDLKANIRLPLLGMIPHIKGLQMLAPAPANLLQPSNVEDVDFLLGGDRQPEFITNPSTTAQRSSYRTSPFHEAFRSLYTNIRFLGSDSPIRSLVISSAVPADGKSTVAINLAQAAAAMGQRVLLVDADLRCPQIHLRLDLPNMQGLSNTISTNINPNQVIQQSPTEENLFVMTAGQTPPDPIKLLSSKKMQNLMNQFQSMFDLIIYDLPPLLGFADSSLLSTHTDGVVMVLGLGKTDRSAFMQALDALQISHAPVLGIVANSVKSYTSRGYDHYSYYHRYYANSPTDTSSNPNLQLAGSSNHAEVVSSMPSSQTPSLRFPLWQLVLGGVGIGSLLLLGWLVKEKLISNPQDQQSTSSVEAPALASTQGDSLSLAQTSSIASSSEAVQSQNPFADAVRIAEAAAAIGPVAETSEQWSDLAKEWQQASELMGMVTPDHPRYAIAQDREITYRENSRYAQNKAEEVLLEF